MDATITQSLEGKFLKLEKENDEEENGEPNIEIYFQVNINLKDDFKGGKKLPTLMT